MSTTIWGLPEIVNVSLLVSYDTTLTVSSLKDFGQGGVFFFATSVPENKKYQILYTRLHKRLQTNELNENLFLTLKPSSQEEKVCDLLAKLFDPFINPSELFSIAYRRRREPVLYTVLDKNWMT